MQFLYFSINPDGELTIFNFKNLIKTIMDVLWWSCGKRLCFKGTVNKSVFLFSNFLQETFCLAIKFLSRLKMRGDVRMFFTENNPVKQVANKEVSTNKN